MRKMYEVSVIVKVAGNEKMLERTMEYLLKQTLPFQESIQVLLLCSKDLPSEIRQRCERYTVSYKENIILREDLDMRALTGRFVCCLGEGQFWHTGAFAAAKELYENPKTSVSLLLEDYQEPEKEKLPQNHFDYIANRAERLRDEPGMFLFARTYDDLVQKIVVSRDKLEVVESLAQIEVRAEQVGVLETIKMSGKRTMYQPKDREWYLNDLPDFKKRLQEMKEKEGEAYHSFFSFLLMRQIADALKQDVSDILDEEEIKGFESWLYETLKGLSDYVIAKGNLNGALRKYAFSLKYQRDIEEELKYRNGKLLFQNLVMMNLNDSKIFTISYVSQEGAVRKIKGICRFPFWKESCSCYLEDEKNNIYPFAFVRDTGEVVKCLDYVIAQGKEYECSLPTNISMEEVRVWYCYDGLYCNRICNEGELVELLRKAKE